MLRSVNKSNYHGSREMWSGGIKENIN